MKNSFKFLVFLALGFIFNLNAQDEERVSFLADSLNVDESVVREYLEFRSYADSLDNSFSYIYDQVTIGNGIATVSVPTGYKFLQKEDAHTVLEDIWGNPHDPSLMGLLLKEDESPVESTYGIEISYSEEGYIEDDDAADLDYDDLLKEMQEDVITYNPERIQQGYPEIELVGWASEPFYDAKNKKLHWAKELNFGGDETNTLNYNIRVLGRKGYLNLNVIGDIQVLPDVQENIDPILGSVAFNDGYRYSDFNPDFDDVAAYGIGGLIAGKILAKAGFFALLLKFWKFIAIGAIALFTGAKKIFFGKNKEPKIALPENKEDIG